MTMILSTTALHQAVDRWLAKGKRVAGPTRIRGGVVQYAPLSSSDELVTEGFIRPINSIKPFILPRHETLFTFAGEGRRTRLQSAQLPDVDQIVVAARPCDAAALPILDHLFLNPEPDPLYQHRREKLSVITLACTDHDAHCCCTSVGSGPGNQRGSDAMLVPLNADHFEVRLATDKGSSLLGELVEVSQQGGQIAHGPERRFDIESVRQFLQDGFEDPIWNEIAMRCHGCAACAHHCPTCHCFDIVDQRRGTKGGRVRNWDSCQLDLYSLHASGHQPRPSSSQRQRNRVYHKYRTYPEKHGDLLCTGCGACTRNCPAGLGMTAILAQLDGPADHGHHLHDQHYPSESMA